MKNDPKEYIARHNGTAHILCQCGEISTASMAETRGHHLCGCGHDTPYRSVDFPIIMQHQKPGQKDKGRKTIWILGRKMDYYPHGKPQPDMAPLNQLSTHGASFITETYSPLHKGQHLDLTVWLKGVRFELTGMVQKVVALGTRKVVYVKFLNVPGDMHILLAKAINKKID